MKSKFAIAFVLALAVLAAPMAVGAETLVPGHSTSRHDADNNGYPDTGVSTVGKYTSVYTYDASGAYYWDLGDGRVQSSAGVASVDDLDQATLAFCNYQVQYRGTFNNNPFLDTGWIINNIICGGYGGTATFNYLIVHETDPRYTGNADWAIWGTWEYHVLTESGNGNLVRPENAAGSN